MPNRFSLYVLGLVTVTGAGLASSLAAQNAVDWDIGPDVRGRNYSVGMPLKPTPLRRGGWAFDFPYPNANAGHVHAVTFDPGSLENASKIVMRYRIDAARGVRFAPQEVPDQPATVSLYFQRLGDSWSGKRKYEFYRWYAPTTSIRQISTGEHEVVVSLADPNWSSVEGQLAQSHPVAFEAALVQTGRIGIAFGSRHLRSHGVYSTGPAKFTLLEFRIM